MPRRQEGIITKATKHSNMVGFITKFLFATTVTAPTFLSLGLIGIIKDSKPYLSQWKELFTQLRCPSSMEWWGINISFAFTIICLLGVGLFLNKKSKKYEEGKTINVIHYSNMAQNGAEQVISSIIPWLTIFADNLDFMVLFVCIMLQCCFIAIASYNSNSYNLICSILGYRYYEVQTEENTYTLITSKCIRNKKEIKRFVEVTDYMGLIIKER